MEEAVRVGAKIEDRMDNNSIMKERNSMYVCMYVQSFSREKKVIRHSDASYKVPHTERQTALHCHAYPTYRFFLTTTFDGDRQRAYSGRTRLSCSLVPCLDFPISCNVWSDTDAGWVS